MKSVIIIPTYNEKDNIAKTIALLEEEFKNIPQHEQAILVVDGNSPDGTAGVVREKMKQFPNIHLFVEPEKRGLGAAYVNGFQYAISNLGAELIFEMDADLQHDPKDVKRLLAEIDKGADCVVGTRFIKGGSIPKEWAFHRKFLSFFGNVFARVMLGTWKLHDLTSGLRVTRVKEVLEKIALEKLLSKRFAYKVDLYYRIYSLGATVVEVPIHFAERESGESKEIFKNISRNDFLDTLKVVTLIRFEKSKKFFQVAIVGVIGFFVQTIALLILVEGFDFDKVLSTALSGELAITSNFLWNNFWTFKERIIKAPWPFRFLQFNLTSLGSIAIQSAAMWLGIRLFGEDLYLIYYVLGVLIGLVWNYLFYSRVIWKQNT